jgi:hypothetical protein
MASVILSSGPTDGLDGISSSIGMMIPSTESFFMEGLSAKRRCFDLDVKGASARDIPRAVSAG